MGSVKASDYIVEVLKHNGINKIFGYIGGAIAHLTDSLYMRKDVEMVNAAHEQGAGFAAEGYARASGKPGVAIATSGPGATNLITPIGSCFFDSVPMLCITGQVNTYEYKYNRPVRQIGFQETDIVSIIKPITKYAVMVSDIKDLRYQLEKCLFLAEHGRKGPVLLDVPMNIQRAVFNPDKAMSFYGSREHSALARQISPVIKGLNHVLKLLKRSRRPIVLAGGGVRLSGAVSELATFLGKTSIPVVESLMGRDAVEEGYPHDMGLIGAYGNRYGNLALANSDFILVLGSRLDTRQTGTDVKTFAREAALVHVDIDKHELNAKVKADIVINADVKNFLRALNAGVGRADIKDWHRHLLAYKKAYPSTININGSRKVPNEIIAAICKASRKGDLVSVDVGQHQMWAAQTWSVKPGQRVFFSGGMGSMGFALPNAIGASISSGKRSIVICGDGGLQMNIQELEILRRRNLPVKIIVLNNANLGMVRQFQELYFNKRYQSTVYDYSAPCFADIAKAYGIKASEITDAKGCGKHISRFLSDSKPGLLDIKLLEKMTSVEPKLIVNKPIEDMDPFLERSEFYKHMIVRPIDQL
ncbi:MAG: acetolactate synthase [Elusimicrobia bacterium GWC2_51_8]|nr:MAG: acetolactate synthase [Elusimicrobia bacterium GWA2_51_34]OGR58609.1 MAG: acetolactate synthase [Elusimicrobia bacterium GWC2_51_8]OGR86051.1 MAG: acetolactate synthase [Elusimicrobia bacterium GWF2_52_66]HAF95795.1 acetolactate synthase [Elusimicrobiota bacterium]HCE99159.1 acetolactate synthase [Elusimicrobiota bacterium]